MLENKLSIACSKFDNFKILPRETIEKMKNQFIEITLEIASVKPKKYTQHELNLKVMCALSTSWHVYITLHPSRPDFNTITTKEIFDLLTGNEYEMIHFHRSAHRHNRSKRHDAERKKVRIHFKLKYLQKFNQ